MLFVNAHVFVIGRASPLAKGTRYFGMELQFPEITSIGFTKLARLTPPGVLIMRPAGRISPLSSLQLPFMRFPGPFMAKRPQVVLRPRRKHKSDVSKPSCLESIVGQTQCEQRSNL